MFATNYLVLAFFVFCASSHPLSESRDASQLSERAGTVGMGTGPYGSKCQSNDNCLPYFRCLNNGVTKTCQDPIHLRGFCTVDSVCDTGLICRANMCIKPTCSNQSDCPESLRCLNDGTQKICAAPITEGSFCTVTSVCATGLVCRSKTCSQPTSWLDPFRCDQPWWGCVSIGQKS